MASVGESSVASVPLSELARMQERLLQQPEVRTSVARMRLSGAATSASNTNTKDDSGEIAVSISESANAYHTPNSSPKAPPRISTSKSASAAEMEMMVNPSPSQEAFRALTRASSFHGYPGGDTQPLESQVYRDFTESVIKSTTTTPKKGLGQIQISPNDADNTYDTLVTEKTPKTCVEGDTGFIDLENALLSPGAQSLSSHLEAFHTSPRTQLEIGANSLKEFALPKTPAAAGHKRNHSGEIVTCETTVRKQAGISQLFGGHQNGPMLSTTQLFNQTQAPSSPMPDGPRSDPVITRPSPNLHNHFSTSSPVLAVSSPVASMRPMTAGEPRDRYTSIRESQERRASRLRTQPWSERDFDDDILDEDEDEGDPQQRRFETKRMQRAKSDQALQEFAKFRAPSRPGSRPTSGRKHAATIDLTTPAPMKNIDAVEVESSYDGHDEDDNSAVDVELGEEGDDEYYELGQTVLRSQGPENEEDEEVRIDGNGPEMNRTETPLARILDRTVADAPHHEGHKATDHVQPVQSVTQQVAIADSQPMRLEQRRSQRRPQANEPPPVSSFVPGSQYASGTSQDQLQIVVPGVNEAADSIHPARESVLSSPPLPVASSALPRNSVEPFSTSNKKDPHVAGEQSIPESDLPGLDTDQNDSSRLVTASERTHVESNNLNVYSTAATHLSGQEASPQTRSLKTSPQKLLASQHSNMASQSPRTAAGVRPFADIAAAQSFSRTESRETEVDVDAFMKDVITTEDQQFIEAMSSPPVKRPFKRRRFGQADSSGATSPPKRNDMSELRQQQLLQAEEEEKSPAGLLPPSTFVGATDERNQRVPTHALQESPSKANEMPAATPESVTEREKAGAKAVSQLLSTRSTKPQRSKSNEKPVKNKLKGKARPKSSTRREDRHQKSSEQVQADKPIIEGREDGDVNGVPINEAQAGEAESLPVTAPNRIFALFKGSFNNFYPATWLRSAADGSTYHVKFDDTTEISIETQHVRKLDLRVGDLVKVDISGMRNKTWLIKSFGITTENNQQHDACTDIYGRAHLQVQAKAGRDRLPMAKGESRGEGEVISVAVSAVYITHTLWTHFKDRAFTPPNVSTSSASRAATPSSSAHTHDSETPSTKSRRTMLLSIKATHGRTSNLREEPAAEVISPTTLGLFTGMVFALSYGPNGGEKEEVARLIRRNGGMIVENGFDELFDMPSLQESASTTPSKKSHGKTDELQFGHAGLHLKPEYQDVGFAALIADRHSRRAKYLQALALGLPTLSGKWITDSLDMSKNASLSTADGAPLQWAKYLLPAGDSIYLGGATRSRTLPLYSTKDAKLHDNVNSRERLITGDGVLIVASKKGKAGLERSRTYGFLTLALGASQVKCVSDINEAKALISSELGIWKWVYVDGSVVEASDTLFSKARGGGKKRKRGDDDVRTGGNKLFAKDGNVRIVNDEFVIQSLILGALLD